MRGEYVHGTLFEIAAAHLYHLTKNHPFVDGNKRTAVASALAFLDLNGVVVDAGPNGLVALVEAVIVARSTKSDVATWLRDHASP